MRSRFAGTFPTVADPAGVLGRVFDFDVVPNGIFVDAEGVIRFVHIGGFDVRRPEMASQVDALLSTDFAGDASAAPGAAGATSGGAAADRDRRAPR